MQPDLIKFAVAIKGGIGGAFGRGAGDDLGPRAGARSFEVLLFLSRSCGSVSSWYHDGSYDCAKDGHIQSHFVGECSRIFPEVDPR